MNPLTKLIVGLAFLANVLLVNSSPGTDLDWSLARYVTKRVEVEYPRVLWSRGISGSGRYRLVINPRTGAVDEVKVLTSAKYRILNEYAAKAFLQWRFLPGTLYELIIPVDWEVSGIIRSFHY